jgi:signal transduction histidine kinase
VAGQLQSVAPTVEALAEGRTPDPAAAAALRDRFAFALSETARLSRLAADYQQLEMFRQKLVKADNPLLSMTEVVARAVNEDLAPYRRLPQLSISSALPADLPATRADGDLLRRAVSGLVGYAAQRGGQGKINLTGRIDDAGWLEVSVAGSAYAAAGAPDESLLDESRQFLARLGAAPTAAPNGAPLVGVVLSRVIIEFYGGSLEASNKANNPGFVFRLPVAA